MPQGFSQKHGRQPSSTYSSPQRTSKRPASSSQMAGSVSNSGLTDSVSSDDDLFLEPLTSLDGNTYASLEDFITRYSSPILGSKHTADSLDSPPTSKASNKSEKLSSGGKTRTSNSTKSSSKRRTNPTTLTRDSDLETSARQIESLLIKTSPRGSQMTFSPTTQNLRNEKPWKAKKSSKTTNEQVGDTEHQKTKSTIPITPHHQQAAPVFVSRSIPSAMEEALSLLSPLEEERTTELEAEQQPVDRTVAAVVQPHGPSSQQSMEYLYSSLSTDDETVVEKVVNVREDNRRLKNEQGNVKGYETTNMAPQEQPISDAELVTSTFQQMHINEQVNQRPPTPPPPAPVSPMDLQAAREATRYQQQQAGSAMLDKGMKWFDEGKTIFISLDLEWWERNNNILTEIGLAVYDPSEEVQGGRQFLLPTIHYEHIIIKENAKHINGRFVADNKYNCSFCESKELSLVESRKMYASLLRAYENYAAAKGMQVVYLGHNVDGDLKVLKKLNFYLGDNLQIFDTMHAWKANPSATFFALHKILSFLNIPHALLHNATNDAHYTLVLAMYICDPGYRHFKALDEEFPPNVNDMFPKKESTKRKTIKCKDAAQALDMFWQAQGRKKSPGH